MKREIVSLFRHIRGKWKHVIRRLCSVLDLPKFNESLRSGKRRTAHKWKKYSVSKFHQWNIAIKTETDSNFIIKKIRLSCNTGLHLMSLYGVCMFSLYLSKFPLDLNMHNMLILQRFMTKSSLRAGNGSQHTTHTGCLPQVWAGPYLLMTLI